MSRPSRRVPRHPSAYDRQAAPTSCIKIIRRDIRGRYNNNAEFKEPRKEPPEDRRVGNVLHLEFVKTQQRSLFGNRRGNGRNGIAAFDLARLLALAPIEDALVAILHEGVEVYTALGGDRRMIKEQVHQHRLATPHTTPDVESFRRRHRTPETKHGKGPDFFAGLPLSQILMQMLKALHGTRLRGVLRNFARRNFGAIKMERPVTHVQFADL